MSASYPPQLKSECLQKLCNWEQYACDLYVFMWYGKVQPQRQLINQIVSVCFGVRARGCHGICMKYSSNNFIYHAVKFNFVHVCLPTFTPLLVIHKL